MLKKVNKGLCLILVCAMLLTFVPVTAFAEPEMDEYSVFTELEIREEAALTYESIESAEYHKFEGYSIEDIRRFLDDGGQIYRDLRVQSDTTGTMTYRVPVLDNEIEYLTNIQDGNIQPFNANPFQVTQIRNSGRSHADSIVIILLGDGFTAAEYGNWPNPAVGTVLRHADNAINALVNTHPFGLFSHLLTVYVIHTHGTHPATGIGYLGTIRHYADAVGGTTTTGTSTTTRSSRIHDLANAVVAPANQTMIQVISNAGDGTGWAFMSWHYLLNVTVSVTSIRNAHSIPGGHNDVWQNGTAWHGTVIHEFGHSFGNLVDEHDGAGSRSELRANATREANNANVKWRHWAGYRGILATPTRFVNDDNWAIPTYVSNVAGHSGCIMRASWGNRNFCGVCTAELVRRMAHISGETFHGRSPSTHLWQGDPAISYPWIRTPTVTVPPGATRILDSAFHGNTSLQTIHIPTSVTTIGDFAFIGATGLRTVHNFRTIPQQINDTTFAGLNRGNITVNIPSGTRQAYIAAGWGGFNLVDSVGDFPRFIDVGIKHWARDQIYYMDDANIMQGIGTNPRRFEPARIADRATFAVVLRQMHEHITDTQLNLPTTTHFHDVGGNHGFNWAIGSIAWANERGIITGTVTNPPMFSPAGNVTREQVATMLFRYEDDRLGPNISPTVTPADHSRLNSFNDQTQISGFARDALAWAVGREIITGRDGNLLAPRADVQRAEIAMMVHRYLRYLETDQGVRLPQIGSTPRLGVRLNPGNDHTFPATTVGYGTQAAHTITVANAGTQVTGNLTVTLSGAHASRFTLGTTSLASIPAGNTTRSFTVRPNNGLAAGTHTATVTVSGINVPPQSFTVSFTVVASTQQAVTFNPQGGLWTRQNTDIIHVGNMTRVIPRIGTYGSAIFEANDTWIQSPHYYVSRTGHTFAGWWTSPTGGTRIHGNTPVSAAATRTLYARWTPDPVWGISLNPANNHTFPAVTIPYTAPEARSITVSNTGNQPTGNLTVSLSGANANNFTLNTATLASIPVGSTTRSFTVQPHTHLAAGTHTATVSVSGTNIATRSFTVSFTVQPTPTWRIDLTPSARNHIFPTAIIPYTAPAARTTVVSNIGNQPTGDLTVSLSGENANSFTLDTTSLTSIPAGATTRAFTVQPNDGLAAGTHTATVTVSGANVAERSFTVSFAVQPAPVNTWDDLRDTINAALPNGLTTIRISNSLTTENAINGNAITIPADRIIVLESSDATVNRTLDMLSSEQRHFLVDGQLTLGNGITLRGGEAMNMNNAGGVQVGAGGTFRMNFGSVIENCHRIDDGGAVSVVGNDAAEARFYLSGAIRNNSAPNGGGMYVGTNGHMVMTRDWPRIEGNTATNTAISGGGGGIFQSGGTVVISMGEINDNTAPNGGGVRVTTTAENAFTMTGGAMRRNSATAMGGDGGAVFAGAYTLTVNLLPLNSLPMLNIHEGVLFSGNTAGAGQSAPPPNVTMATRIRSTSSSVAVNHPLNNMDINYRGRLGEEWIPGESFNISGSFECAHFYWEVRRLARVTFDPGPLLNTQVENIRRLDIWDWSWNNISSLAGIEFLTGLEHIAISNVGNDLGFSVVDLSNNKTLRSISFRDVQSITHLTLPDNPYLEFLYIGGSNLEATPDLSRHPNLWFFSFYRSPLSSLDVSNNPHLINLDVRENPNLRYLDVSNNPNLSFLDVSGSSLTGLDVSNNLNLNELYVTNNYIPSLDHVVGWDISGRLRPNHTGWTNFHFFPQRIPTNGLSAPMVRSFIAEESLLETPPHLRDRHLELRWEFVGDTVDEQARAESIFAPDEALSRRILVTVLYQRAGSPEVVFSPVFGDVAEAQPFSNAILWAYYNGIVRGTEEGSFGPDEHITREAFAMILYRFAAYMGYETDISPDFELDFPDAYLLSDWAAEAMRWANYLGIINGTTAENLHPELAVTRADASVMLQRFVEMFE